MCDSQLPPESRQSTPAATTPPRVNDAARSVTDRAQLRAWFTPSTPSQTQRIGTEHEKFPYRLATLSPVPYAGPGGIAQLLTRLSAATGWAPLLEAGHIIGLRDPASGASISLEPAGQVELSGAPLNTVDETATELHQHLEVVTRIGAELGIGFASLGTQPLWGLDQAEWMPKERYRIMRQYMPRVGSRGLDMMTRTATVQTNIDYSDEADMVQKLRVAMAIQPVITALWANSPFFAGRPTGRLSERSAIWCDTDPDRTGILPFIFEPGMSFDRYIDYVINVPMYFVSRGSTLIPGAGATFADFMAGKFAPLAGQYPTSVDFEQHISTIFPEVRLKQFIELRGADAHTPAMTLALTALSAGLFYHQPALAAASELIAAWSGADIAALRAQVPTTGLATSIHGMTLAEVASVIVDLAREGLIARGRGEEKYLAPVASIATSGKTRAQWLLAAELEQLRDIARHSPYAGALPRRDLNRIEAAVVASHPHAQV